jgi:hypothetical protein
MDRQSGHLFPLVPALAAAILMIGCSAPAPTESPDAATAPAMPARHEPVAPTPTAGSPATASNAPATPSSPSDVGVDPGLYSELEGAACKTVSVDREAGGSTRRCPGVHGYQLLVQDSDARMSIDVVAPDGSITPLQLSSIAGNGAFSSLGPRAEWRPSDGSAPTALIVRFNVFEQPEQPDRPTSYLVVARLAANDTCAVGRIAPGPQQNAQARKMAATAAGMACMRAGA